MKEEEFLKRINDLNVNSKHYSLNGDIIEDILGIKKINENTFYTYYVERNKESNIEYFNTYQDALDNLFNLIVANLNYGLDLSK